MKLTIGPWSLVISRGVPAPAPPPAPVAIPSHDATLLTDEAFIRIWSDFPADDERLRAFKQLLARELVAAIQDLSTAGLAERPGALAQAQGAMIALLNFSATIDQARQTPEQWTNLKPKTRRPTR